MRGRLCVYTAVLALACSAAGFSPPAAMAGHVSKDCGVVSQGSHDYRIHAMHVRCRIARTSSVRYLRTEEPRPGFDCAPTAGGSFYCQDPPKAYWGIRL
jgi:hypothetical protein